MSRPVTEVEVSFFKPAGFADKHYVDTAHRGDAVAVVLGHYDDQTKGCLNYATARHVGHQPHFKFTEPKQ